MVCFLTQISSFGKALGRMHCQGEVRSYSHAHMKGVDWVMHLVELKEA